MNESYAISVKVTWSELSLCDEASVWPVEESLCGESFEQALAIAASRTAHKNKFFKFLLLNSLLILFSLSFDVLQEVDPLEPIQRLESAWLGC